ncbi:9326_t:CDS:1, partial [Acaulospora morrowiae]
EVQLDVEKIGLLLEDYLIDIDGVVFPPHSNTLTGDEGKHENTSGDESMHE